VVDYAVHIRYECVCVEEEERQAARVQLRFGFVFGAHPRVPSPQKRVSVLACWLVLHSFLTQCKSSSVFSHIIRCSSDQNDTLLSTNVAEEQDAS
jgi:hypothetical protein